MAILQRQRAPLLQQLVQLVQPAPVAPSAPQGGQVVTPSGAPTNATPQFGNASAPQGSYARLFGQPPANASGPFGFMLGDPSRWKGKPLPDGNATWLVLPEDNGGNVFMLLYKGGGNTVLYGWPEVQNRDVAGYEQARAVFNQIESAAQEELGLAYTDGTLFAEMEGVGPGVIWPVLHQLPSDFWEQLGDQEQALPQFSKPVGVATPGNALGVQRIHNVAFTIAPKRRGVPTGQPFTLIATVNPWLRIGYITGFGGNVTGGDTWIPQAIETVEDIIKIVVGALSFNAAAVVSAVVDLVQTWWDYELAQAAAENQANARGDNLGGKAQGSGSPPSPDGRQPTPPPASPPPQPPPASSSGTLFGMPSWLLAVAAIGGVYLLVRKR